MDGNSHSIYLQKGTAMHISASTLSLKTGFQKVHNINIINKPILQPLQVTRMWLALLDFVLFGFLCSCCQKLLFDNLPVLLCRQNQDQTHCCSLKSLNCNHSYCFLLDCKEQLNNFIMASKHIFFELSFNLPVINILNLPLTYYLSLGYI